MIQELMARIRDLEQRVENMIRVGVVSSITPDKGTARVAFSDRNNLVSHELPILVKQTLAVKDYYIPDVGEHVVCVFLPNGVEAGFILGAFYSDSDTTPVAAQKKRHITFDDGTVIEYDRESHTLLVDVKGDATIVTTGNVNATVGGNVTASITGTMTATIGGDMAGTITGNLVTEAANWQHTGNVQILGVATLGGLAVTGLSQPGGATITGGIEITGGDVTVDGISVKTHTHGGVTVGPGDTGVPQ